MAKGASAETGARIADVVRKYHDKGVFDGVVLAARNGEILYRGATGLADRTRHLPHDPDTPFSICSITKQFTALLVMQQAATGALRLDGTLRDYLPDLRKDDAGGSITVEQMLTHTSGLPNTDDFPGFYTDADPRLRDFGYLSKTLLSRPLDSAPGAHFRYNNADYLVLCAILERQTGQSYERLLQERILRPLRMSRTGVISPDTNRSFAVVGYVRDDKTGRDAEEPVVRRENFGAAGALYSTLDDLLRWDRALQNDWLIPRRLRDVMWRSHPEFGYVAYGSWVYRYLKFGAKAPTLVERQGGIGAMRTQNLLVPEDGLFILLMSNLDSADLAAYTGQGLTCDILRAIYST